MHIKFNIKTLILKWPGAKHKRFTEIRTDFLRAAIVSHAYYGHYQ
jgi:hypothetical protein